MIILIWLPDSGAIQVHQDITTTKLTNELQVKPDLVHPPGVGPAKDDAGRTVEAQTLKLGPALFPSPAQNS